MDNCKALKHKVQELIDCKAFKFTPTGLNVRTNPITMYVGPLVNVIEEVDNQELTKRQEEIRAYIFIIWENLMNHGLIPSNHVDGEVCTSNPRNDESLKRCIQQLIDQGTIKIGLPIKEKEEMVVL